MTEQSKDNPVFYVQYASARCHSSSAGRRTVCRRAIRTGRACDDLSLLTDESELALIRKLAEYPGSSNPVPSNSNRTGWPFICMNLPVASMGTEPGADNQDLRFVKVNDRQLTNARLGLVQAVSDVLTSGLALIGAEAPKEMR